jgi:BMFP domain-containing protein YqiC
MIQESIPEQINIPVHMTKPGPSQGRPHEAETKFRQMAQTEFLDVDWPGHPERGPERSKS